MTESKTIVGLGLATVDCLGAVDAWPTKNAKSVLKSLSLQGGGPAATATAAAAKLGARARFIGSVGDDDFGRSIVRGLEEAGVDVRSMVISRGKVSPFSFVATDPSDASRTVFHSPGTLAPLDPGDLEWSWLQEAAVLMVDGRQCRAQVEAARRARALGVQVLLDADSMRPGMEDLQGLSAVVIASERFAEERWPDSSWEHRLQQLTKGCVTTAIVTLGEKGAVGLHGGELLQQGAHSVGPVVDTTGCGDVYHGAYAVGMVKGWSPPRCMELASVAAALKCRSVGGRAGLPVWEEVQKLIRNA